VGGMIVAARRQWFGIGFAIGAAALCVVASLMNLPATVALTGIVAMAREQARDRDPDLIQEFDTEEWNSLVKRHNEHALLTQRFRVLEIDLRSDNGAIIESPVIYLRVLNGTKYPVRRVYFHAVLKTAGRDIPWVDTDFNYEIPGGLQPGEEAEWELSPNLFDSKWKYALEAKDAVLQVTVENVDGADGKPLFPDWTEKDQAKLDRFRELQNEM